MSATDTPTLSANAGRPPPSGPARPGLGVVVLLVNRRAGSTPDGTSLREIIEPVVADLCGRLAPLAPDGASVRAQIAALHGRRFDTVIAAGGDGTVNAAARLALDAGARLAIAPAGTMNLVARDLGVGPDPAAAVEQLAHARERSIDVATVNGSLFVHSSLIGLVPSMARYRERARCKPGLGARVSIALAMIRHAFRSSPVGLTLETEAGRHTARSRCLAVTNNPLAEAHPLSHRRASLDAGRLGVYASLHEGPFAVGRLLAGLASGRLSSDPEVTATACTALTVDARARTLLVSNDGEIRRLRTPLEYRVLPRALRVLVPAEGAGP